MLHTIEYTVKSGDTLYSIAQKYFNSIRQLLFLNPKITNPSLIYPGQVINVLSPGLMVNYFVHPGDTLYKIAQANGMTLDELLILNPQITNPNLIYPGMQVWVSEVL
jgi:LysM repeat protein